MAQRPLNNYLRTFRKRAGLSQEELAHLLGFRSGTTVARYERGRPLPSARTVFALEVIFQMPAFEIFAGVYHDVENDVAGRARRLRSKLNKMSATPTLGQKVDLLHGLCELGDESRNAA